MLRRGTITRQEGLSAEEPRQRLSISFAKTKLIFWYIKLFSQASWKNPKYFFLRVYTIFARALTLNLRKKQTDD